MLEEHLSYRVVQVAGEARALAHDGRLARLIEQLAAFLMATAR